MDIMKVDLIKKIYFFAPKHSTQLNLLPYQSHIGCNNDHSQNLQFNFDHMLENMTF